MGRVGDELRQRIRLDLPVVKIPTHLVKVDWLCVRCGENMDRMDMVCDKEECRAWAREMTTSPEVRARLERLKEMPE